MHDHELTPAVVMTAMTRSIVIGAVVLMGFAKVMLTLTEQTLSQFAGVALTWVAFK
jgi:hypothetical protein